MDTSKIRSDGWTAERQRFLQALSETRDISRAAAASGMSREGAYRLRSRRDGALFAALWDGALEFHERPQVHTDQLSSGLLMRLRGNHYRRKSGDFTSVGKTGTGRREP